jgi:molecular chaperone DnaK (HSP70)
LELSDGVFEVKATNGDTALGGEVKKNIIFLLLKFFG